MPRRPAADPALRRGKHTAAVKPEHQAALRRTTLPGGLRVVTEHLPAVRSASVGVWVGVGSRDEGATVAGAAHFLEHLLFKSTPTRTAVDIAQAMDAVGGELNAFTSKEHTCYYAHVLDSDLELAVDLVADVVLNGRCAADDVELERDVVLEEIAMRDDDPEDALGDLFLSAMFGDHPVGRPVIGTAQSVSAMTRTQLHSFHVRRYTPERMVVAVAGNVDHDEVVALVREHFGPHLVRGRQPAPPRKTAGRVTGEPTLALAKRDAEQTHLSLGVRTPGRGWEHRWALAVLQHRVGRRTELRLFQEVRESRGLAYSVYSAVDIFADSGALSVYAACQPERFADVMQVTSDVLEIGGTRRHHRGGMPHRQGLVARRARPRPGGFQFADEPHRAQRVELRKAPQHRAHLAANRRRDRRRGQRGRPPVAGQAVRRRRRGSVCFETIAATTTSGDGKLAGWYWASGTSWCPSLARRCPADPAARRWRPRCPTRADSDSSPAGT